MLTWSVMEDSIPQTPTRSNLKIILVIRYRFDSLTWPIYSLFHYHSYLDYRSTGYDYPDYSTSRQNAVTFKQNCNIYMISFQTRGRLDQNFLSTNKLWKQYILLFVTRLWAQKFVNKSGFGKKSEDALGATKSICTFLAVENFLKVWSSLLYGISQR